MKKLLKNKLFLAIAGGLVLIFAGLLLLESSGSITIPDITAVRLYRHSFFSFGAPEYLHLPFSYSRLWDLAMAPVFIGLLLWSMKHASSEANLQVLFLEALVLTTAAYFLTSIMIVLSVALLFTVLCGYFFGDWTAVHISVLTGLIAGIAAFGLLYGLIIAIAAFLANKSLKVLL
ncbi:MAG: hypothetical protein ACM3PZ_03330 [Bacillota bacterium]